MDLQTKWERKRERERARKMGVKINGYSLLHRTIYTHITVKIDIITKNKKKKTKKNPY